MADLINTISSGPPKAIGVDILFSEPEGKGPDEALGRAISEAGNVVLATGFLVFAETGERMNTVKPDYLWEHAFMEVKGTKDIPWKRWVLNADSVLAPVAPVASGAEIGSVYTQPDRDGVLRWEILALQYDGDFYPSMPLQVVRIAKGLKPEEMSVQGGTGIKLGAEMIPTDFGMRILLNYRSGRGGAGGFRYIPAADLLKGRVSPSIFKDRIVLLGTSALATYDQKVTPLSSNMPGVEKNATVIDNIINRTYLTRSPGVIEMVITVLTAVILSIITQRTRALVGVTFALLLIAGYIGFAFYMLEARGVWLNVIYPVGNMGLIFVSQGAARFFLEELKARNIRQMFSSYVSPKVVEALIENPEKAEARGRQEGTHGAFLRRCGLYEHLGEAGPGRGRRRF